MPWNPMLCEPVVSDSFIGFGLRPSLKADLIALGLYADLQREYAPRDPREIMRMSCLRVLLHHPADRRGAKNSNTDL